MPDAAHNPEAQFNAVESLLTRWLRERRELLARYTEVVVTQADQGDSPNLSERQRQLCQLLLDYLSAGHFEVFQQLLAEAESFGDGSAELAQALMPGIEDTTDLIIAYDEKYNGGDSSEGRLKRDLTALGETLERRFEIEDRLIAGLHNIHRRQLG